MTSIAGMALQAAIVSVLRSCIAMLAICVSGVPVFCLLSSRSASHKQAATLLGICGLFTLNVLSWYVFVFHRDVRIVYVATVAVGVLATVLAARYRTAHLVRFARDALTPAVSFVVAVFVYSVLAFMAIEPRMLPWLDIFNGDLLTYLKCANLLLQGPSASWQVNAIDLHKYMEYDVFGAFNFVGFSSFVTHTGVQDAPVPSLGALIGFSASTITVFCRRVFSLPAWLSVLIPLMVTTSPLTSYIVLQCFFAQLLFVAVLLNTVLALATLEGSGRIRTFATLAILSNCVLFCYHPWFEQFVLLGSVALAFAWGPFHRRRWMLSAIYGIGVAVLLCAGLNAVNDAISADRFSYALAKLAFTTSAASASTGWPLPFINLGLLLSIPFTWQDYPAPPPTLRRVLPALTLVVITAAGMVWFDRGRGARERRFVLGCTVAALALYLGVWWVFGPSYKQWKFATTLTAPLGFAVAASVGFLASRVSDRRLRAAAMATLALLIGLAIEVSINQYLWRWSVGAFAFPEALEAVARVDRDPGVDVVLIDIPSILMSMAAAVFINHKPILFSGPSEYGEAVDPASIGDRTVAVIRYACGDGGTDPLSVQVGRPLRYAMAPLLPTGRTVDFDDAQMSCLSLRGFSGAEPRGRWTDGRTADISFRCACDLTRTGGTVSLQVGSLIYAGLRDSQTVVFRVNGVDHTEVFTSDDPRPLELPVTSDGRHDDMVDIAIDLPDAVSPKESGLKDTRTLGIMVSDLTFHAGDDH